MFVNSLYNSHACAILVSEENEEPIIVPEHMAGTTLSVAVALLSESLLGLKSTVVYAKSPFLYLVAACR
jgi:hypothetical protein